MGASRTKRAIGQALPYGLIEGGRRVIHAGPRRCPVCGSGVRRFLDEGYGYPLLEALQVVGGLRRPADRCPVCHAAARDRLVWFYLERHVFGAGSGPVRVLHMAPEKGLSRYIAGRPGVAYRAGDIEPGRYRHLDSVERVDLLDIPADDASLDLVVCNHVLEHIPDDLAAMREIRRVLAPEGRAILQVPLSLRLDATREGDGSESPEEKIRLYGQDDHVRLYAAGDYAARLARAGFAVERYRAFDDDAEAAAGHRLDPFELLHVCRPGQGG